MPIRSGLIVVLRLFAILIIFQILGYMLAVAATIGGDAPVSPLPQIAIVSLLLIPFLLIFWCSAAIVDFLTPKPSEMLPEGPVTGSELQAIAFSAMGAFILSGALTSTIGLVAVWHFVSQAPGGGNIPLDQLLQTLLGWVVGLYLLVGAPGLRQWITGLRTAGPKPD